MSKKKVGRVIYEYLISILAALVHAVAMRVFINPAKIVPGGITGVASVISYVTSLPVGVLYFILNLPLLILAIIKLKGDFTVKTVLNATCNSIFLEILPKSMVYLESTLLSVVMGGALVGLAMHLAYKAGGSNGGTEIIAKLINKYKPEKDVSGLILILNGCIVLGGSAFMMLTDGNVLTIVYSVIYTYLSSWFMGALGREQGEIVKFFIITEKTELLRKKVAETFDHGFSIVDVYGRYGAKKSGIIVIIKRRKESAMRKIIRENDPMAFVIVKEVYDVLVGGKFAKGKESE